MRFAHPTQLRSLVVSLAGLSAVAAHATLIEYDLTNPLLIPTGGQGYGYYVDIAQNRITQDPNAPWVGTAANFQLYRATGTIPTLRFASNNGNLVSGHSVDGWVGSNIAGPFSLDPFTSVGATSTFVTSNGVNGAGAYRQDRVGYLGIRFLNSLTGQTNYGWMEILTQTTPYQAYLTRFAFDDAGAAVITPTPEPTTLAALGLGALALARRRRRA